MPKARPRGFQFKRMKVGHQGLHWYVWGYTAKNKPREYHWIKTKDQAKKLTDELNDGLDDVGPDYRIELSQKVECARALKILGSDDRIPVPCVQ